MAFTISPTITPLSGTKSAPLTAAFAANANGGELPYAYVWDFGDGLGSVLASDTHAYGQGRTFTVTLHATDALGATASFTTDYVVNPVLAVNFSAAVIISPVGANTVSFMDHTSGGTAPYTYHWDFGDGQTSTAHGPGHTYAEAGYYVAVLTITDADGHVGTYSLGISITVPMTVAVTAVPVLGSEPMTVDFTALASMGQTPYTYTWNFGDGSTATGASVSHSFVKPGRYEVRVGVVDGLSHDAGGSVFVDVLTHLASDPDRIPERGKVPFPVTFYANAVGGKKPYDYLWDFQDGSTSTEANPVHNFKVAGFYNVTLTITDDLGRSTTNTVAVDAGYIAPITAGITIYLNSITIYSIPFTIYGQ